MAAAEEDGVATAPEVRPATKSHHRRRASGFLPRRLQFWSTSKPLVEELVEADDAGDKAQDSERAAALEEDEDAETERPKVKVKVKVKAKGGASPAKAARLARELKKSGEARFLPRVLCECIMHIKAYGLHTEGVFRIPGSAAKVQEMLEAYERGETRVLERSDCSVHDAATLLKQSIRRLPEPLVPFAVYKKFLRAARKFEDVTVGPTATNLTNMNLKTARPLPGALAVFVRHRRSDTGSSVPSLASADDGASSVSSSSTSGLVVDDAAQQLRQRRAKAVCDVALTLPPSQCQSLSMVLNLLFIVSELSDVNRMTTKCLSVVFAPTLMSAPATLPPQQVLRDMPIAIAATRTLIENAAHLPTPDPILVHSALHSASCVA